jgi:ribonuclease BN (tRNA processing enzyme)
VKLTFLGTSDAFGAGGRRQAALFVETRAGGLLVDCAPTTNTALAAEGVARDAIDAIALSHFHADHFAGVPSLVLACVWADRRRRPLLVAGPPGVEQRVLDAAEALGHPLRGRPLPFALRFLEIGAGGTAEVGPARIAPFATRHDPESCPHGLAVEADGRRLVYSGDTGWFDELPDRARGADLFVCECNFHDYELATHLSYRVLHDRRRAFDCGRMLLTHLGSEMTDRRGALEIETADDGMAVDV